MKTECTFPKYDILSFWVKPESMQLCKDCIRSFQDQQYKVVLSDNQEDLKPFCEGCNNWHI